MARKMLLNWRQALCVPRRNQVERKYMTVTRLRSAVTAVAAAAMMLAFVGVADAQRRNERDVRDILRSIPVRVDNFESLARYQMQSSSENEQVVREFSDTVRDLRTAVDRFQGNFDRKRENRTDADSVVSAAVRVHQFMMENPQNQLVEREWVALRGLIDRLAANYGTITRWDDQGWQQDEPDQRDQGKWPTQSGTYVGISGTYDLDRQRSDNIDEIVGDTGVSGDRRSDLRDKLESPQQVALDIRGNRITLASSNAPAITFTADGNEKVETNSAGDTVRVRATLNGNVLTVASRGGETDFTITFTSESDGRVLKVSRRITTDYLDQTVFAESIYNKTDSVARLGIDTGSTSPEYDPAGGYSDNDQPSTIGNGGISNTGNNRGNVPTAVRVKPGNYVVPNGATVIGNLENEINTKVSQNNDRFRLTVQSPDEFRGAVIEGYISGIDRSGRVTGQSKMTLNFERITLRSGQSYDFTGSLQDIRDTQGRTVRIDSEGTARGDSQTRETVKRGGIGAGVGAIIGAIAGGAKGAAIGAAIGGGAGAGTVVLTGKEDVRLLPGSTVTIQAAAPPNSFPR
jgi:hypothetical protein